MKTLIPLLRPFDVPGKTKIRLGREYDGGYVIANELIGMVDHIVSSELSGDISFEYDFMLINNTCDLINYDEAVKNKDIVYDRIKFVAEKVDGSNCIASITAGLDNVFLKLDIEGSEYDAFRVTSGFFPDLSRVVMLVIELHDIAKRNYARAIGLLSNIEKTMTLFHVHGNAWGGTSTVEDTVIPNVVELTFINNKYVKDAVPSKLKYPIVGLDMSNKRGGEDIPLDFIQA